MPADPSRCQARRARRRTSSPQTSPTCAAPNRPALHATIDAQAQSSSSREVVSWVRASVLLHLADAECREGHPVRASRFGVHFSLVRVHVRRSCGCDARASSASAARRVAAPHCSTIVHRPRAKPRICSEFSRSSGSMPRAKRTSCASHSSPRWRRVCALNPPRAPANLATDAGAKRRVSPDRRCHARDQPLTHVLLVCIDGLVFVPSDRDHGHWPDWWRSRRIAWPRRPKPCCCGASASPGHARRRWDE